MDINFELYKIFYQAAKIESFSEAAEKLHISQSAVSQAIKNLEKKMGVQLFFRHSRQITLTLEGDLLYKHIAQAYNFIKTAENKINEMQNLDSGEVRIGVSDTVCRYFLIPYLEQFNARYAKIKIQVINRTSQQILGLLKNGMVDFGIVTLPVNDKNLLVEEFMAVEDIFVASDKFKALQGQKITLPTLAQHPLLMLEKGSATRQHIDSFLHSKGVRITPEIELGSIDLLVEFARIGLGIACVLRESAVSLMKAGELFEVQIKEKLPRRKLGIVVTKDVPLSHAAGEFIAFLKGAGFNVFK